MRQKSEVYEIFIMFQRFIENQLNHKIKIFQSDGGGEFTSNKFQIHLQKCGIKQNISCPHTPEQNGVSERKHRHVIELGLAMMYHAKVPMKYWVDAFKTAIYVINLLPTTKLHMHSPHYNSIIRHQTILIFESLDQPVIHVSGTTQSINLIQDLLHVSFLDIVRSIKGTDVSCLQMEESTSAYMSYLMRKSFPLLIH